jgi:hypothetical protein
MMNGLFLNSLLLPNWVSFLFLLYFPSCKNKIVLGTELSKNALWVNSVNRRLTSHIPSNYGRIEANIWSVMLFWTVL